MSLLRTNDPPSAGSCKVLTQSLTAINNQLADIEETLRLLRKQQTALSDAAQSYRRILHPIRRVPSEILRAIFEACFDSNDIMDSRRYSNHAYGHDSLYPRKPRGHWVRSAIHGELWHYRVHPYGPYVGVKLPNEWAGGQRSDSGLISQLILQLQRSKLHPLAISIRITGREASTTCERLIVAICFQSFRWDTLRIHFQNPRKNFSLMSSLIKGNLPMLRRLYVDFGFNPLLVGGIVDTFESAPMLRELCIHGLALPETGDLMAVLRLP
ncbi:hypothetical protein MPER_10936 [Moniliophthora perniciosa FA553]|nr:hypothetical protein MPER_10936 [Moniliophthora perniciosa FA553]